MMSHIKSMVEIKTISIVGAIPTILKTLVEGRSVTCARQNIWGMSPESRDKRYTIGLS